MSGTIDIYHSRRANYEECEYWARNESERIGDASQWILNKAPSGMFYAREISAKENRLAQLGNVFAFDENHIALETDDDIHFIRRGCIVRYNEEIWMVENVQSRVHRKESQFDKEKHYKYYINLRR